MQYKTLRYKDSRFGRMKMETTINEYGKRGWRLADTETKSGRRTLTRSVVKGAIFLPWGVTGGKKKGELIVTMEHE